MQLRGFYGKLNLNCWQKKTKKHEALIPLCNGEAVVCAVEARRRGVADVCDLRPGTALQENDTFVTVALK